MKHLAPGLLIACALSAQNPAGGGIGGGLGTGSGGGATAAPAQPGDYPIGNGVSAPRLIQRTDPAYSDEARACSIQGTVLLGLVVGADGTTGEFAILRSLGYGLDEQAVEAVRHWSFQPGVLQGIPVPVRANIEVNFRRMENPIVRPGKCDDFLNGVRLLEGNGVTRDEAGGVRLLEVAAAANLAEAQYRLASLYEYGDAGVMLNNKRAEELYRACLNLVRCQANLSRVLVSDSLKRVEGMAWLELAAEGGSIEARQLFASELEYTPAPQLEQARAMKKILLPE